MAISPYKDQRIMLLARLRLGIASKDKNEIDLYNYYLKNINFNHKENKSN